MSVNLKNADLKKILDSVSQGNLTAVQAQKQIEKLIEANTPQAEPLKKATANVSTNSGAQILESSESEEPRERLKSAFEKLRKSVNIDELLKISSGLVHQIAETMPHPLERIQENISSNFNTFAFSPNAKGIDSKLSVFRTLHFSDDSVVTDNHVVGSQWFGVNFSGTSEISKNKFTAVQFSEVAVMRSNFVSNVLGLTRLSNASFEEARFEENKTSRSTFSDFCLTESDFTGNRLTKCEFAQTVVNASRIAQCVFNSSDFKECEFDQCDLQGLTFENCIFNECTFQNLEIISKSAMVISNHDFTGRVFSEMKTIEELLKAFESCDASSDALAATAEESETRKAHTDSASQNRVAAESAKKSAAVQNKAGAQAAAFNSQKKETNFNESNSVDSALPKIVINNNRRTKNNDTSSERSSSNSRP